MDFNQWNRTNFLYPHQKTSVFPTMCNDGHAVMLAEDTHSTLSTGRCAFQAPIQISVSLLVLSRRIILKHRGEHNIGNLSGRMVWRWRVSEIRQAVACDLQHRSLTWDDQASANCSRELSRAEVVFREVHHSCGLEASSDLIWTSKLVRETQSREV